MKIAIQQPYFFPYLNYFCLISQVDKFVIFDQVQYVRHAWFERNRVLKPCDKGWQWIMAPLQKHSHTENLLNIRINNNLDWQCKMFAQLKHYKKKGPYYHEVMHLLCRIFEYQYQSLIELNVKALQGVCDYLKLSTEIECLSCMDLKYQPASAPDEWAINICHEIKGADQYYNLPGGLLFFDQSKYAKAGIQIYFPELTQIEYNQKQRHFEPNLSVLDVMMFNSPETIRQMLSSFRYL